MADREHNPPDGPDEEADNEEPRARRRRAEVVDLLRLLAGQRVVVREREAAAGNDELVAGLKRSGMLSRWVQIETAMAFGSSSDFICAPHTQYCCICPHLSCGTAHTCPCLYHSLFSVAVVSVQLLPWHLTGPLSLLQLLLCSEGVTRAMLAVPRGSFVPPDYQAEAWVDSPIRVSNSAVAVPQRVVHLAPDWDLCALGAHRPYGCPGGCHGINKHTNKLQTAPSHQPWRQQSVSASTGASCACRWRSTISISLRHTCRCRQQ
jgi:hypothetical protein